ncbi:MULTISPECIES: GLPGLI family protein [Sphingobacterium]|uniref:GLPGLI family protein n=1 Tax=Sphingobacterium populi TaxID=1812824 RepID=A0ABW5UBY4_9SPHI|nr:GLPGLI family protein [Sphingobacterium sp. CFCC 11742]
MKKRSKVFHSLSVLGLLLTIFSALSLKAQEHRFLIAKYITNPASTVVVDMLKKQISDKDEFNKAMNQISKHNYYFTLIYDTENNTSLYRLDSASTIKGVNAGGNFDFAAKDKEGSIFGKENFVGNTHYFNGKTNEVKWEITNEKRKIGNYECIKAISKNLRKCEVWFTEKIPVNSGPEIFGGLPGLIIKVESAFDQTSLQSLKFVNDFKEFEPAFEKAQSEAIKNKKLPLDKIFESKNNTITMLLNANK